MAEREIPHTWCIFEHPILEEGRNIPQMEPLYDNIGDAIEAIEYGIGVLESEATSLPGWIDWRVLQAAFNNANVPTWARTPLLFRGQSDFHFGFQPTMLRGLLRPEGVDADGVKRRETEEKRILNLIFNWSEIEGALPNALDLSATQRAAVARHYGAPSMLSDFSASIDVAAFFASQGQADSRAIGVIYCLSLVELLSLSGISGIMPAERGVLGAFSAPFGETSLTVLVPGDQGEPVPFEFVFNPTGWGLSLTPQWITVPECRRIEGQKAVFLEMRPSGVGEFSPEAIASGWTFLRLICRKFCFRQGAGSYTNQERQIMPHQLMPPNDPIEALLLAE